MAHPRRLPAPLAPRAPSVRRSLARAAALGAILLLSACAGAEAGPASEPARARSAPADALAAVTVTGEAGAAPEVSFTAPLRVTTFERRAEIEGSGGVVPAGGPLLLRYRILDATTGAQLADTYAGPPVVLHLNEGELDAASYEALQGARYGERLSAAAPSADGTSDPAVFVIDVLPLTATGTPQRAGAAMPRVTQADDGRPQVARAAMIAPAKPQLATLIKGSGRTVAAGDTIVVQFVAVRLDDGKVTQTTWDDRLPLEAALDETVEAWRDLLPGVATGSRVEILSPPEFAAGDGATVYVIDVLASSPTPPAASPETGQDQETP